MISILTLFETQMLPLEGSCLRREAVVTSSFSMTVIHHLFSISLFGTENEIVSPAYLYIIGQHIAFKKSFVGEERLL